MVYFQRWQLLQGTKWRHWQLCFHDFHCWFLVHFDSRWYLCTQKHPCSLSLQDWWAFLALEHCCLQVSVGQQSVEVDPKVSRVICLFDYNCHCWHRFACCSVVKSVAWAWWEIIEKLLCAWSDLACLSWKNKRRENLYSTFRYMDLPKSSKPATCFFFWFSPFCGFT